MEKKILEKYIQAGIIAKKVLDYALSTVKEGMLVVELAEKIEAKIFELGGEPAFPVNISINEVAAHYTPTKDDKTVIKPDDYLKIDVGVHVDGYIADTARTVVLSGRDDLVKCAEKMLSEAIRVFVPGTRLREVGAVIESVASDFGFSPVRNLTGHRLSRFDLHSGTTVPNFAGGSERELAEGEVYAIEPFVTTGSGWVKDTEKVSIFKYMKDVPCRLPEARKILRMAREDFRGLPFARRWLNFPKTVTDISLRHLVSSGALHPYYILKEVSGAPVAQAEHTVVVADKPKVLTAWTRE